MIRNSFILKNVFFFSPKTVIHIGAHHAQDHSQYKSFTDLIIWGEADINSSEVIKNLYPSDIVINKLFYNKITQLNFYKLSSEEENSAKIPVDLSKVVSIVKMRTTTLDSEFKVTELPKPIMLTLDTQGSELEVLQGGIELLKNIKYVVIEISVDKKYEEINILETYKLMKNLGFKKSIFRSSHDESYIDQLFIRSGSITIFRFELTDKVVNLALQIKHYIVKRHFTKSLFHCKKCASN